MISMIAAIGKDLELGYKNQLLCHLPKDLKHFKETTSGHTVIMGRKTWESLPKKPLPNRRNIVMTNSSQNIAGAEVAHSLAEVVEMTKDENEVFVMGGASVYELFMPYCDKLYLTKIVSNFEADVFFPEIDMEKWMISEIEFIPKDEKNEFDLYFQTLIKKK